MMDTLETTSKRTDESKIELSVTLSAEDTQKQLDAVYKEAGKIRIPGFRAGKAPRRILENHYGGKTYFLAQATDELINGTLQIAIDQEGFVPLDKPDVPEPDLMEEGKDFTYLATFTVRPVFELSSYDPVQIELPSVEPTAEEIQDQIDVMTQYYIDYAEVTDRPVEIRDMLTLDMEIHSDNKQLEALSGSDLPYESNMGTMPPSFDEQLIGMNIGETKEFEFSTTANEASWMQVSAPSHAVVTIKGIKAMARPELTDEWVREKIEYDSVQDFKNRITESLRAQKKQEIASLRERLATEELATRLEGEPTEILITQTEQGIYRDFFASLQQDNRTFDAYLASSGMTATEFRQDIKKQATEITIQALALDAMARHLDIEITEADIREEFLASGAENPEALYQEWKANGRISEVRDGILRIKASDYVNENAEIFEVGKKPEAKKPAKKTEKKADKAATDKPAKG